MNLTKGIKLIQSLRNSSSNGRGSFDGDGFV